MNRNIAALIAAVFLSVGIQCPVLAQDTSGGDLLLPAATYNGRSQNTPNAANPQNGAITLGATAPLDPSKEQVPESSVKDKGFQDALKTLNPLSPDQINEARKQLDASDKATGMPLGPITPKTRSISVSMKPGELPPVIKVAPGWVSTLTFSDVTGQPWPVLSVTRGNPDAYEVLNSGTQGATNIITISTKQAYVPSNIAVTLIGAKVPLLMTLEPSASQVDYRVDAQLDMRGPNASLTDISKDSLTPTNDSTMLAFLDGVPPDGAKKLGSNDREVQVWRFRDMIYVRTTKTMLSPAYNAKQSNVSGVSIYVLNEAPVLLMSEAGTGRMQSVRISR